MSTKQLSNAESLQKMIDAANEKILCGEGTECYFKKHSKELETIFRAKTQNNKTAPEQLTEARKNYYVYAYGNATYKEKETERLENVVNTIITNLGAAHNNSITNINTLIDTYDTGSKYHIQLYSKLQNLYKEDNKLSQEIDNDIAGLKTADRKIYYENEEIKTNDSWVTTLTRLYWVVFVIFVGRFLIKSLWKNKIYIAILIGLILWPFVSNYIAISIIKLIKKIITYLPTNVYTHAENM